MADTPEEVRAENRKLRRQLKQVTHIKDALEDANKEYVAAVEKLIRENAAAEARGFAKGLEAAEKVCEAAFNDWTSNVYSPGWAAAAGTLADRVRAIAPKAPPEVAAAEPKP